MAEDPQFNLEQYSESILHTFPPDILDRLDQMTDFRKAYEVNPELAGVFKKVGIEEDLGKAGLTPSDWPQFGPVQKTLAEFKAAYDGFYHEILSSLKKPALKKKPSKNSKKKSIKVPSPKKKRRVS